MPGAPAAAARPTDGQAIAALVIGIAGLFICPLIGGIVAIILGSQARDRLRADPTLEGEGLARAAIIIGWIGIGLGVLGIVFLVFGGVLAGFGGM